MSEQPAQFRSALHGFNREDVVAYLDRLSREHEEALSRMRDENAQLRAELAEAQDALAEAEDAEEARKALEECQTTLEETKNTLAETEKELADAQSLLSELRNRNGDLEDRLHDLSEELEELRAQAREALTPEPEEPPAPDYRELELAAYRRAEQTERLARERAGDVYRQVESVFGQSAEKLEQGKADLEALSQALTGDVNALLTLLTRLNGLCHQTQEGFGAIGARSREILEEDL